MYESNVLSFVFIYIFKKKKLLIVIARRFKQTNKQ